MGESVVTQSVFFAALARASRVEVSAYVLDPRSPIVRTLEACGDRHADVTVRLDGAPYVGSPSDDAANRNARVAADLEAHGVAVVLSGVDAPVHMKAAVVDGTAYLDDRNWPSRGPDTLVATSDRDDVAVVAAAIAGRPASDEHLATEKAAALVLEAHAIASGTGDRIDIVSETFGYSAVSKALYERARAGATVRLLVARREYVSGGATERAALARLASAGVSVRIGGSAEKFCTVGDRGWVGSANASYDTGHQLDWGMATSDPAMLSALAANFNRDWAAASVPVARAN